MSLQFIAIHRPMLTAIVLIAGALVPTRLRADGDSDAEYLKVVTQRAEKILAPMHIDDDARRLRVRDLIAGQYVALSQQQADFEASRDAAAEQTPPDAKQGAVLTAIEQETDPALFRLHRAFVARLGAELSPEQVEQIKDGITYRVVPITYGRYLELLPALTEEQKAVIRSNLLEAREYAMDAGSSEKKHAWFDKFKGRINNYLSSQGYNLKQAEQAWQVKQKSKKAAK